MINNNPTSKFHRKYACYVFGLLFLIYFVTQLLQYVGLRYNSSQSMPYKFWQSKKFNNLPQKNQVVVFCPPACHAITLAYERGYFNYGPCPGGCLPLLKPIVAVAGDNVDITVDGIRVNGHLLPNSASQSIDNNGQFLPKIPLGRYQVKKGQVWLVSNFTSKSFDSRYFGPIAVEHISHSAQPLWSKDF